MNRLVVATLLAVVALASAACAGGPATSPAPSAQPPRPVSDMCTGIPTYAPGNPVPELPPDPALAPSFPNVFGGIAPGVEGARLLDNVCFLQGEARMQQLVAQLPNVNFETLTVATANDISETTFDSVQMVALRTPGQDANVLTDSFLQLSFAHTNLGFDELNWTRSTANLGGKNVTLWTDPDSGQTIYTYVSGDTIYGLYRVTEELAATVFAAFP